MLKEADEESCISDLHHILRTTVLKTPKLLEGAFSATSTVREDVCTVFCGNTENTDTAEQRNLTHT